MYPIFKYLKYQVNTCIIRPNKINQKRRIKYDEQTDPIT